MRVKRFAQGMPAVQAAMLVALGADLLPRNVYANSGPAFPGGER
jgi:hypothetical protein